jgi:membrane protease YdiL (CAAX protease family)
VPKRRASDIARGSIYVCDIASVALGPMPLGNEMGKIFDTQTSGRSAHSKFLRHLLTTAVAFVALWLLLDRSAYLLGSLRGEMGVIVCLVVLSGAIAFEMMLGRASFRDAVVALGLRMASGSVLLAAGIMSGAMLCYYPIFSFVTGVPISVSSGAALLALGIFAQGGVAEEVVFRGFLFRRLRSACSFWQATLLAAIPFVAVHALLFRSLDFPIALSSLLLALSISFPLAWLFEISGNSIWPAAIVHAVIQGTIKLVDAGEIFPALAIGWIGLSATVPWLLFLLRRSEKRPKHVQ